MLKAFTLIALLLVSLSSRANTINLNSDKVAIIASGNVTDLNINQLKNIYSLNQKILPSNARVKLVHLPLTSKTTQDFSRGLFNIYPYQLQRVWDRQVFSGRARSPNEMNSESDVFAHLSETPNTIAYVSINSALFKEYKGKVNVLTTF